MTFWENFNAAEQRAHNQLIATKILKELSELRSVADSSPTVCRRWVWELIQNAKDVGHDGRVRIAIDFDLTGISPHVTFRHNGRPFSAENVRFLIEQVSSKDRRKDETGRPTSTGKFGTGFLTTHLLSEIVHVEGVAKEESLAPVRFDLILDRTGFDLESITSAVGRAKASLEGLDDRASTLQYNSEELNTCFRYELTDESGIQAAQAGLSDLAMCLPYTLAFVREIESVTFGGRIYSFDSEEVEIDDDGTRFAIASIRIHSAAGEFEVRKILTATKELTTIAIPIRIEGRALNILEPGAQVPRLHCDLPLIGTEAFPFPVLINSPIFNPTDARDGVFLTSPLRPNPQIEENKAIVQEAYELYLRLLTRGSARGWRNMHLLAKVGPTTSQLVWVDSSWFERQVVSPIRTALLQAKIVRTAAGQLASILDEDGHKFMWFPTATKRELRARLWRCAAAWFPHCLPDGNDVEFWASIVWDECGKLTLDQFAGFVEGQGSTEVLTSKLSGGDVCAWLTEFYGLFAEDDATDAVIRKRKVFPNQHGQFCRRADLCQDAGDIDPSLLDILLLLGNDLRNQMLHPDINIDLDDSEELNQAYVVKEITSEVHEKTTDREVAKNFKDAFQMLLLWFKLNPGLASSLFPGILRSKHLLYDDEQILENIERAEQLNSLLMEFKVASVEDLRNSLKAQRAPSQLLPVTEDIIAKMGISSIQEWHEALEDRDLAALFSHESTPTTDMFVYAQSIIRQSMDRVIKHLRAQSDYDLSDMDETAPTILAGIRKGARNIMVVVRPAYDGEVIIYYGSERDVLDFEDSELWVDDGARARRVTLGGILKSTQIRRFPV